MSLYSCKQCEIVSVEDPCVAGRTDLHLKDHEQHSARSPCCLGTTELLFKSFPTILEAAACILPIQPAKDPTPVTAAPAALIHQTLHIRITFLIPLPLPGYPQQLSSSILLIISLVRLSRYSPLT
jgi:hypothetical protein